MYHKSQPNVGQIYHTWILWVWTQPLRIENWGFWTKGISSFFRARARIHLFSGQTFCQKWLPGRATLKETNTWFVVLFFDIGKKNDIYIYIHYISIYLLHVWCLMKYYLRMRRFLFSSCCSTLGFLWKVFLSGPAKGNFNWKKPGGSAVKHNLPCIYPNVLNGTGQFTYKTG